MPSEKCWIAAAGQYPAPNSSLVKTVAYPSLWLFYHRQALYAILSTGPLLYLIAEGKREVRERRDLADGICTVAERDLKKISKGACHNEPPPLLFDFFQNHRFLDLL